MEAPLPLIHHVDQRAEGWIAEGHKKQPLGRYTQRGLYNVIAQHSPVPTLPA